MKTVEIPPKPSRAKTKWKPAPMTAERRKRLKELVKMFGTFEDFMTLEELQKMREES